MEVETFECVETAAEPIEASEEAIRLLDELGLEGQREMICPHKSGRETRAPYREMTKEEQHVYAALCPTETRIKEYKSSPIPLRVLQVAAHATQLWPSGKLYVLDRETVTVKDPVLIARVSDSKQSWITHTYILARWGEHLETFVVLRKRAVEMQRERLTQEAKSAYNRIENMGDGDLLACAGVAVNDR